MGRGAEQSHLETVADAKSGLAVGDVIRLGRNPFRVVGLVEDAMNSGGDATLFSTLRDAQALQTRLASPAQRVQTARGAGLLESQGSVAAVIARPVPNADPQNVAQTVRQWKHLSALTQADQESILPLSVVDRAKRQIGLFLAILLTVSAVVNALIISTMTMEKLTQIATLKLIGAPDRIIVALMVQQSLAPGAVGWSFGLILILLVKDYFPRRVVLEPMNAVALAGIILVVYIFDSGLGVRAALTLDPSTAIGG